MHSPIGLEIRRTICIEDLILFLFCFGIVETFWKPLSVRFDLVLHAKGEDRVPLFCASVGLHTSMILLHYSEHRDFIHYSDHHSELH